MYFHGYSMDYLPILLTVSCLSSFCLANSNCPWADTSLANWDDPDTWGAGGVPEENEQVKKKIYQYFESYLVFIPSSFSIIFSEI